MNTTLKIRPMRINGKAPNSIQKGLIIAVTLRAMKLTNKRPDRHATIAPDEGLGRGGGSSRTGSRYGSFFTMTGASSSFHIFMRVLLPVHTIAFMKDVATGPLTKQKV
jgi:hypothetical protein